jgi:type 1 glutamine amidotransferase
MEDWMKRLILLYLFVAAVCQSAPLKVHMLSGSEEYRSEESLQGWAAHLKTVYGIDSTFSLGTDKCAEVDGLEHLKQADVLVVFCRRWKLTGEQAQIITDYIESGKPVLGIRTASHAFEFYKPFDKAILGGDYSGHEKGDQPVKIERVEQHAAHPVLKGVTGWERLGKPYKNPAIAADARRLLYMQKNEEENPLAWTRTLNNKQRVFYTSLGIPSDFQNETFIRLLDNALFWLGDEK